MALLRAPASRGTTTHPATHTTVFIDTSLDTHLALLTADSDTVSNLKDHIVLEHGRCIPKLGKIMVHALKVKRGGHFYHLADYMFVKSAFEWISKSWFLYAEVSICNDVLQIEELDDTNQKNELVHDQEDHLRGDCTLEVADVQNSLPCAMPEVEVADVQNSLPCAMPEVEVADVQNSSGSSKAVCNVGASPREFKDENYSSDNKNGIVSDSYSSGQSVGPCNYKRKRLLATSSATKYRRIQNNKANKLLVSHVEFDPQRDARETSSSNVQGSKQKRKSPLQANSSPSSAKCKEVNECMKQNAESEKVCASSGNDDVEAETSICSPGINNTLDNDMPKMDHMDKTIERNLQSIHDPEVNPTGQLIPSQDVLEKKGESTLPSALSDTKEVNVHRKCSKKRANSSKIKFLDAHVNQVRNLTADSHIVLQDTNVQELPERAKSEEGRLLKVDNFSKTEEPKLSTVHDPEMRQYEEIDLSHCKSTVPSVLLVTKEVKAHESSGKKRSDDHMDRSTDSTAEFPLLLPNVAVSDHQCCESTVEKGNSSSKADARAVEQNVLTKIVDIDEATEGVNRGGKKKKRKVKKSGASVKKHKNRKSIVAENDLNIERVPETKLSSNSECPDVLEAFEAIEATEDGKAIGGNKKKQKVEKAVARVQEKDDMNRDADQINDIVTPSLDGPDTDDLVPPSENDEIYQKSGVGDLLVDTNFEDMVVSGDIPSYRDIPVIETVSIKNMSTATVAEQKLSGTILKTRAKKTDSVGFQDGMDTENTDTRTRSSYTENTADFQDADVQVDNAKDHLPVSKGIEESAREPSDTSRGKNTPPIESPLNQVPAELKSPKERGITECTGKEINAEQYFVPSHHQDEVTRERSAGAVTKQKREEVAPSDVSTPKLQQYIPKSSKKDSIISSAGKANNLTESNEVSKTKRRISKRGVPFATTSSDLDDISTPKIPVSSAFLNGSDATKTDPHKRETVKSLAASSSVNSSSMRYEKLPLKSTTRDRKESSLRLLVTTMKNPSSKIVGEVVNKSKQEKSLGLPKAIFRDISSGSSSDGNAASTHTSSNNSSSSSDSSVDDKDIGGIDKIVSNSDSGLMQIPMDKILRSSSKFKKAKLTASQQVEDPDNLHDFISEATKP